MANFAKVYFVGRMVESFFWRSLVLLFSSFFAWGVWAQQVVVDKLVYQLDGAGEKATAQVVAGHYSGVVRIPERIQHEGRSYAVTGIAEEAFAHQHSVVELHVPASVRYIGPRAFLHCNALRTLRLEAPLVELAEGVFQDCEGLTELQLPSTLRGLGKRCFAGCSSLRSLTLPEGVTALSEGAFAGCRALEHLPLPKGIRELPANCFSLCRSLTSIELPEGVEEVGDSCFRACEGLTELRLPRSLRRVGREAFAACLELESVELPVGLSQLGERVWEDCSALTSFRVAEGNAHFSTLDGVLCDASRRVLLKYPEARTGHYRIPDSIVRIGRGALAYSHSLSGLDIPEGVQHIEDDALLGCALLERVLLPASLRTLGRGALAHCAALTSIEVAAGNANFAAREGLLYDASLRTLLQFPAGRAGGCVLPESVERIAARACYKAEGLRGMALPVGLRRIDDEAFAYCTDLAQLSFPPALESIGSYAFFSCFNLPNFTLPATLKSLGASAFEACENAHELRLLSPKAPQTLGAPFDPRRRVHILPAATGFDVAPWTDYEVLRDATP